MTSHSAYLRETLATLVATPSVNPYFDPASPGEGEIARLVESRMRALGMETTRYDAEPGRTSTVGRLRGSGGGRSLMLYAHHDTVGPGDMANPFRPEVRDGRMFGRGAYDMKSGLAACLAAVWLLRESGDALPGDVVIASVADEEVASIGIQEVLKHVRTDGAVVTEATELELCLGHKGFVWIEVKTLGRAAHGSRFAEGIDANLRMGRVLGALETLERQRRESAPHPLLGPPSMHVGVLAGGAGESIYSAQCTLKAEFRTLPGETEASVLGEVERIIARLAAEDPTFRATARVTLARPSFTTESSAPIVVAVRDAAAAQLGAAPRTIGVPYWMDASLIAAAGIETVVLGPVGAGAHADVEWVDLGSVERLAEILAKTARQYCRIPEAG